ncbi:MAG: ABC transporter ATP-binding protein [Candidatus Limnocylindrales bacterium]
MTTPLLEVRGLCVRFVTPDGTTTGLDGVSLEVGRGEILGVVGETGCGKTLTGLSVLGLLPRSARVADGSIRLDGRDLLGLPEHELRKVRGADVAMVFQNPASAFNPVFTIGWQMRAVLAAHERLPRAQASERIAETLADVGLPETRRVLDAYPHELSGGMLQRAMIATALLCRPRLLIADEPTTALDVTIEAQILRLVRRLQESRGFSVLFITHDLGVIRSVSDRVAVLYAGRVVETAPTAALFAHPEHPYTRGLIGAIPSTASRGRGSLVAIPGSVPADPGTVSGCAFADRCSIAVERCTTERPEPRRLAEGHAAACHLAAMGVTL